MKKWLPYVVAIGIGLAVAALMFLPGTGTPPAADAPTPEPEATTRPSRTTGPMSQLAAKDPEKASPEPPPPPGTIRPMNDAEIKQQAREARPFNAHTNRVQTWWQMAAKDLSSVDPDLSKEARDMMTFVREQSRLNDDEVNIDAVIQQELDLERKIRARGDNSARLTAILDYINSSANSVIQGGDPAAIPKPTLPPE